MSLIKFANRFREAFRTLNKTRSGARAGKRARSLLRGVCTKANYSRIILVSIVLLSQRALLTCEIRTYIFFFQLDFGETEYAHTSLVTF